MRRLKWVALAVGLVSVINVGVARADQTLTVFPNEPDASDNCYPFGYGLDWTPYAGYVYKNLPAFELRPNDVIAFDLSQVNDADIELEIALARTTTNGGNVQAQPFQTVVTNTQTPSNPRGDTTVGNFELQFRAESSFSFPGGGMIIRFSDPSSAYAADAICNQIAVAAGASDSSGLFVERFYSDADGLSPWPSGNPASVGAFQIRTFDQPPPPPAQDTDRPETTITRGMKRSETGKAKFRFESDEAGSSFECKVKGKDLKRRLKQFRDCDSPHKYKGLDEGRYKFKVRAIDAAGNVDATPAKDRFRVV